MALINILSSLHDGSELSLMNGDNNPAAINLPRLWLLLLRNEKLILSLHEVMTAITTYEQRRLH